MRRVCRFLSAQMHCCSWSCGGCERRRGAACVAGGTVRVRGRRVRVRRTYLAACRPAGKAVAQLASVLQNASSRSRPFFAFARLEGGQPLTVAQLALETLLTALLSQDKARSGRNSKFLAAVVRGWSLWRSPRATTFLLSFELFELRCSSSAARARVWRRH